MIATNDKAESAIPSLVAPIASTSRIQAAGGILECIGDTPLVQFRNYLDQTGVELYAKLECFNPGGSAKDRPAMRMLACAIQSGDLTHRSTVIESSSGNMGIGLTQFCRFHGIRCICVVDPHAQRQNIAIMRALGAEVVRVDAPIDGSFLTARLRRVQELLESIPHSFWPNQYANRQNPAAHCNSTMREIDLATRGNVDFVFVATSSTGTAQGCRDFLRQHNRKTKVIAVDAFGSVLFGGTAGKRLIPGLGAGQVPELARGQSFDDIVRVSDIDCVVGCRRAAEREAVLVGGSAGGVLEVIRSRQNELQGKRCVAILHDSGTRYLETIFNDDWVENSLGTPASTIQSRMVAPALNSPVPCGEDS